MNHKIYFLFCSLFFSHSLFAEDFHGIQAHGVADFRYLHTDSDSQHNTDFSVFRDGGANRDFFRVNEAALTLQGRISWSWTASITAKYAHNAKNPVDISEAVLFFKPVSTSPFRFNARLGSFYAPISLENTGTAWTSPYTLTSSSINSWVGEELKTFGGEATLGYYFENGDHVDIFVAGFGNNDTTGTLLAFRGWRMHDYEATILDGFKLPNQAHIQNILPKQAMTTQPFVEVDGRAGYYAGFNLERPGVVKFRALYYDNMANPTAIEKGQYGWHTRFGSAGLKASLPFEFVFVEQSMLGNTQMGGLVGNHTAVDVNFWAHSFLLSKKIIEGHRLSVRYELFGVHKNDEWVNNPNESSGSAWTANYNWLFLKHHQLNFEVTTATSNVAARSLQNIPASQDETFWQVGYRMFF
jgi:hypothetical protein